MIRHLPVVEPIERTDEVGVSSRPQSELGNLLEGMESVARRLQESVPRFLMPNDYAFLREDRYRQESLHQTAQRPELYAVK